MKVINIQNNNEYYYCCPADKAVVNAYYQFELKNFNTWGYDYSLAKKTHFGYLCGDYWAKENIEDV